LDTNGVLWGAGRNNHGELGIGVTTAIQTAVKSWNPATTGLYVVDVAANGADGGTTCIVLSDGTVRTAGYNGNYQCGNGNTTTQKTWVNPTGGMPSCRSVSAWGVDTNSGFVVLCNNGDLYGWGYGGFCTCTVSTADAQTPSKASTGVSKYWLSMAGSLYYMKAASGVLYARGANQYGELGLGNTTNPTQTAQVVTIPNGETLVELYPGGGQHGYKHCAFMLTNSGLYAAGENSSQGGRLGEGSNVNQTSFSPTGSPLYKCRPVTLRDPDGTLVPWIVATEYFVSSSNYAFTLAKDKYGRMWGCGGAHNTGVLSASPESSFWDVGVWSHLTHMT
jgi:alpha-tubulin suppressor-like RCC1 family protein